MAGNPLIKLGSLSRLRGSLTISDYPELNVTAPFLGRAGLSMAINGDLTQMLPQMVGMVQSQEVYLPVRITVPLVKTMQLANLYKRKWESDSNLGDCTFRGDATNLDAFDFVNCSIENLEGYDAGGTSGSVTIIIAGTYYVNNNLWG